ncbi:hypothetical protein BKA65DRAFT_491720 [Rhexocercosporidium sp. MPI-PUGE-AT-0058]|nr:hypothetical protein BKA65DRAFT_491720 [Rhexocercosporidium sp. MPI-PUGE-AT-0058]
MPSPLLPSLLPPLVSAQKIANAKIRETMMAPKTWSGVSGLGMGMRGRGAIVDSLFGRLRGGDRCYMRLLVLLFDC